MRITQLGPYPPPSGGVQTNLAALHERSLQRGWTSTVVNLTRFRQSNQPAVYYPNNALDVVGHLIQLKPQIAHLHIGGNLSARLLALGALLRRISKAASVLTLHSGGYPATPAGRAASPRNWRGLCLRQFDCVIAVNEELADMLSRFGVSSNNLRVIPPYVLPASPELEIPEPLSTFMNRFDSILVSMGWLEPEYDYQLQIAVMKQLVREYPRTGLLILGEGSLRNEISKQIAALNLADHVLLAGDQPRDIALAILSRSRILLRTTWYDGDAISIREALHFNIPVIASDNGMRPDGVRLFSARDGDDLFKSIIEELSQSPPPYVKRSASYANIDAVLEVYQELAGG